MIYLLIIVGTCQLLYFIYSCKIFNSVKRRYKVIDGRIANLSQWVISGNQALSARLEKMQAMPVQDEKPGNIGHEEKVALLLIALLSELSKKEALPHHYIDLLEQLQQHHKTAAQTNHSSETVLRPVNRYAG